MNIVFIHGLVDNLHWDYKPLVSIAKSSGATVHLFNYDCEGFTSLSVVVEELHKFILKNKIRDVHLFGYSMGGVVASLYTIKYGVKRLFVCVSPIRGSYLTYLIKRKAIIEMRPKNISQLDLYECLKKYDVTSVWTPFDLMIVPQNSGAVGKSHMILWPFHSWCGFSWQAKRIFKKWLNQCK